MNRVNKKGQFFILAAVIIAVAVVGLAVVYNTVNVGDSPKKFYSYSNQLWEESGAVVDYSLYTGDKRVDDFVEASVNAVIDTYPEFDVFACYTDENNSAYLICDNYGGYNITVETFSHGSVEIPRGSYTVESGFEDVSTGNEYNAHETRSILVGDDGNLTIRSGSVPYFIDLTKASSASKYYFIFRANTTAGNALVSTGNSAPTKP